MKHNLITRSKTALAVFKSIAKAIGLRNPAILLTTALLSACAVGPDYQTPHIGTAKDFQGSRYPEFSNKAVEVAWWKLFKDEQLNHLVDEALQHNYDLKAAQANLREARALYMEAGLNLAPTITSHANYTQQLRSVGALNNRNFVPRDLELFNTGFDAYWEVDFFGRVRRNVEASNDEVELREANIRDVSVSLTSEVARNYFELRGLQHQLNIVKQNVENQAQTLKITEAKVRNGRGTELDSARASAQLDGTRAMIPTLETAITANIHRLSVLTGRQPDALVVQLSDAKAMPQLPDTIAIGSPADLLRRRPDIRMAERRLAESTAKIGVATADLFPRVTFVGTFSMEASTFSGLGAAGSNANSFGPRITWAAFNLGQVYARIKAADAHAEGDLALYQQTVLTALEETENALVAYNKIREKQALLKSSSEASLKANNIAQLRYKEGVSDFLTVLDSELRLLQDQNQLAINQTATAMALVSVYKALGGGWEL